jgi:hypothetical protein
MKDMIFLAPSTGARPSIWASGDVQGFYSPGGDYPYRTVDLQGSGLDARFTLKEFDTTKGLWKAYVHGGGTLTEGHFKDLFYFEGLGAGHIDVTKNTFSGTAAGLLEP